MSGSNTRPRIVNMIRAKKIAKRLAIGRELHIVSVLEHIGSNRYAKKSAEKNSRMISIFNSLIHLNLG